MFLHCFCVLHMPGEACAGFQAVPRSSFCRWSFGRLGFLRGQDVCGTFQDFDGFLCIALYLDVFGSCQVFAEPIQHSCITHVPVQGQLILFHSNSWEGSRSRKTVSGLSALRQTPFIHHWRCDTSCGHRKSRRWRRGAEIKIQEEEFNRTCTADCGPEQAGSCSGPEQAHLHPERVLCAVLTLSRSSLWTADYKPGRPPSVQLDDAQEEPYEPEPPIEISTAMPCVVQLVFPPASPRDADPGGERERSPRRRRGSDVSTEAPLPEAPPDASMDPVRHRSESLQELLKGAQRDFVQKTLHLLQLPMQDLRFQLIKSGDKPKTLLCQ